MSDLAKLTITPQPDSNLPAITVLFNPNTYSIGKGVTWSPAVPPQPAAGSHGASSQVARATNAPELQFSGGQGRSLTLDLFFDTTEETDDSKVDVRNLTNQVVKLTKIVRSLNQPPWCVVSWGKQPPQGSDFPFTGVVTQLRQDFKLFLDDGRPLRANLNVTFTEWLPADHDQRDTDPEFTTRLVKRGDTLSSIAAEVYRDPTLWRVIAEANQLDDPRQIPVGLRLSIPKLS